MLVWPTNAVQRWQMVHWSFHHAGTAFVFDGDENLEKCIRERERVTCSRRVVCWTPHHRSGSSAGLWTVSENCSMYIDPSVVAFSPGLQCHFIAKSFLSLNLSTQKGKSNKEEILWPLSKNSFWEAILLLFKYKICHPRGRKPQWYQNCSNFKEELKRFSSMLNPQIGQLLLQYIQTPKNVQNQSFTWMLNQVI